MLLAVNGYDEGWSKWLETWKDEETTLNRFYDFIDRVVNDLNDRFPGQVCTFTIDNLNIHKDALVMELIINGGHQVIYCASYWPVDGDKE